MKHFYILLFLIAITSSCQFEPEELKLLKQAKQLYSASNYVESKKILAKIEKAKNYKKEINTLKAKIDSVNFQTAVNQLKEYKFHESIVTLREIEMGSQFYPKKRKLLDQIDKSRDSLHYYNALDFYYKGLLRDSKDELEYLNRYSPFLSKKKSLLKKIKRKRRVLSYKESKLSKAVISSIFGTSTRAMRVKEKEEGVFYVTYYKDGRNWTNKVRFSGNKAEWGSEYGRWRSDNLTYSETKNYFVITETFGDGSMRKDRFIKSNL